MFALLMNNLFFLSVTAGPGDGPAERQFVAKKISESSIRHLLTCRVVDRFS